MNTAKVYTARLRAYCMRNDQTGAALAIALLMLLILTLMGASSIMTSIDEIRLSGNKRGATNAFYTADGGIESVASEIENFDVSTYFAPLDPKTLPPDLKDQSIDSKFSSPLLPLPKGASFRHPPKVTIFHSRQVSAPRASGFSAIGFEYEHFIIDSIGTDQIDAGFARSSSHLRKKVVTVRPTLQGGY